MGNTIHAIHNKLEVKKTLTSHRNVQEEPPQKNPQGHVEWPSQCKTYNTGDKKLKYCKQITIKVNKKQGFEQRERVHISQHLKADSFRMGLASVIS